MPDQPTYFFSYARDDAEFALKLAKDLREAGARLWVDQLDIPAGHQWDDAIEEALEACPCMLVVLSPTAVASRNVKDEINYAIEEDKRIVPVIHLECAVPFRLRRIQRIDLEADYHAGFARLKEELGIAEEPTTPRPEEDQRPAQAGQVPTQEEDETLNPRIRIEGGTFQMGSGDDDSDARNNEKPQHTVTVSSFWIQEHPVTNEEYKRFKPSHPFDAGREGHPVVEVSWQEAMDYAQWLGGSLPTEAQWEFAARGTEGRKYPWGSDKPTPEHANYDSNVGDTTPVATYPKGTTPEGVHDLAGNVWEWCSDWHGPYTGDEQVDPGGPAVADIEGDAARLLRGGAFDDFPRFVRCAYRRRYVPNYRDYSLGFRVVAPVQS